MAAEAGADVAAIDFDDYYPGQSDHYRAMFGWPATRPRAPGHGARGRSRRSGHALGHDGPMSEIEIPRPTSGDVLERILEDHRLFEDLLRLARRNDTDREAARHALAEVLVAHATAEEEKVYPTLRKGRAITAHEEEHGEEEHAEIIEALLEFLRPRAPTPRSTTTRSRSSRRR